MTKKQGNLLELKHLSDMLKNPRLTLLQRASLRIRYEYLADELRVQPQAQE